MTVSAPTLTPQFVTRPVAAAPAQTLREAADRVEISSEKKSGGGTEIGNMVSTTVGGMLGLGMILPGVYAGVLGGAVVGSLLGVGFGPAIASIASEGALGFLSTSWQTAGLAARAGMFIGGASGIVGGWKMGTGIGHGLGRILGAEKKESSDDDQVRMKGLKGVYGSLVAGGGLAAGAVGGGIIGGSVAATGSLIKGLAGKGFEWGAMSGMAGAGAIGGIAGLATGAVIGGYGGYTLAKSTLKGAQWVYEKVAGAVKPAPEQPKAPETKTN